MCYPVHFEQDDEQDSEQEGIVNDNVKMESE